MMRGRGNGAFVIAEAGVNHNGSLRTALDLVDAAREAGADAVKFQTFKTEKILARDTPMAAYQAENTGSAKSQFEMIRELELSYPEFAEVRDYCAKTGILFLSTPDEEDSLDFLVSLGMPILKVGSAEVDNIPFLRKVGSKRLEVILSSGMSTLGEIERARAELLRAGAPSVALLHCTTNYPCPMAEVNLRAMLTLKQAFGGTVGYSDHTLGIEIPVAAVALGAGIIEKHFTLDKSMPGPDHKASLDPAELRGMVSAIRNVEASLGDGIKAPMASELAIAPVVRKSIVAARPIRKGALLSEADLAAKRIGGKGLPAGQWDWVVGRIASRDFAPDEAIEP